jgi:prophage DNA circulation protein
MHDTYFKGAYKQIFSTGLQKLLTDFRDPSPGILFDPVYGEMRCVPSSYSDELDSARRSGVDLTLEFLVSPEDEEDEIVVTPVAAVGEAETLAAEAQKLEQAAEESAAEISPQNSVKLKDALAGLAETGRRILATPNDIRSELNQIAFFAREIEDVAYDAHTPEAVLTRNQARDVRDKVQRVLDNSLLIRPVKFFTVEAPISIVSLASNLGVTFEQFIAANPALSGKPTVSPGTSVVIPDGN